MTRKTYAAELKALGARTAVPRKPSRLILEAFPNPAPGRDYSVRMDCAEFTSMCPLTGQPDYGRFEIEFVPQDLCLESKSLKLYLASFRNEGAFWEELCNRIADDIYALLKPQRLCLRGYMNVRGGIGIMVEARRGADS